MNEKRIINFKRQDFLDIAKAFSIFTMIYVHVLAVGLGEDVLIDPKNGVLVNIIGNIFGGVLAAPVFMFCMGIGIAYSKRQNTHYYFSRGKKLFSMAWLLNIVRYVIPVSLIWLIKRDPEFIPFIAYCAFSIDILHFAGLSFLLYALLSKLRLSDKQILILSVFMSVAGSFIREFDTGSYFSSVLTGCFFGCNHENFLTAFPLFNWFIFVAAGKCFGEYLKRCDDISSLFRKIMPPSSVFFLFYSFFGIKHYFGMFGESATLYYHMHTIDAIYAISAVFTLFGISYFVSDKLPEKVLNTAVILSKNLNYAYCLQWLLVGWIIQSILVFGLNIQLSIPWATAVAVLFYVICIYAAIRHEKETGVLKKSPMI